MTGHGGWPMTVFLTPDGVPFYGGTYFPTRRPTRHAVVHADPHSRLERVSLEAGRRRAHGGVASARCTTSATRADAQRRPAHAGAARPRVSRARRALRRGATAASRARRSFRRRCRSTFCCGTGRARGVENALAIVTHSFTQMARGGIYDQVGGGFARYAVDAMWLVPHFEKMLYDNALLIRLGAHLWQATKDAEVRRVVEETIDWAAREMRSPEGGFYSSLDADSEGHEGKFYVWSAAEIDAILGDDAPVARAYWGVTTTAISRERTFSRSSATAATIAARSSRSTVEQLDARSSRARRRSSTTCARSASGRAATTRFSRRGTGSWCAASPRRRARSATTSTARWRSRARRFCSTRLVRDGRVLRSYKDGRARIAGYLEDHAALGLAALAVYELTFDDRWLDRARAMATSIGRTGSGTTQTGAFFDTASDHETLITRPRDVHRQRDAVGHVARRRAAVASRRAVARRRRATPRDVRRRDARAGDRAISVGVRAHARLRRTC